jgi:hypothetical protein
MCFSIKTGAWPDFIPDKAHPFVMANLSLYSFLACSHSPVITTLTGSLYYQPGSSFSIRFTLLFSGFIPAAPALVLSDAKVCCRA